MSRKLSRLRISRADLALPVFVGALAGVIALGVGIPALGQSSPQSILPPGFGEPAPAPSPRATPRAAAPVSAVIRTPPSPLAPQLPDSNGAPPPEPLASAAPTPMPTGTPTPGVIANPVRYDMPSYARRWIGRVGPIDLAAGGLPATAFGTAPGRYVEALMRGLNLPIASRWLSIALRRALVSHVDTPPGINGADFAAERAWLLLRMGESVAGRAVVQSVDNQDYTPKLYEIAMQSALANGDPAELCPLAEGGYALGFERGWVLARAMCAGLAGLPGKAQPLIAAAGKNRVATGIDLLLAQKIAGSGARGRQAVTIEWDGVDRLTAWRYGLAMASATEIPTPLLDGASRNVMAWRAQSPLLAAHVRAPAAEIAAARGVFSSAALVDLYGAVAEEGDDSLPEAAIARDLQTAYSGGDIATRLAAIKSLWDAPKSASARYARLVLTAGAAARVPVRAQGADADRLVASMLAAGHDVTAQKWRGAVATSSDAWAMLALADPEARRYAYSAVSNYAGTGDATLKRKMFFAGLAGLGRISPGDIEQGAQALDVRIGQENAWTRALARAATANQPGTVVLLAAVGMQTPAWSGVSPEALYHIIAALRAVGLEGEARMIAAEAIARL
nr:hypothetical protein [Sphingomonas panacis]